MGQGQGPEEQGPEQGGGSEATRLGTPDTRAEARRREHHTGLATSAAPQASSGPRAAGPGRRNLSCSRAWALQTPCRGADGTGLTKSSEKPDGKDSCVSRTNLQQQLRRPGRARGGRGKLAVAGTSSWWPGRARGGQDELAVAGCGAKPEVNTDTRALGVSALGEKPLRQRAQGKAGPGGGMLTPAPWGLRPLRTPPQPHRSPQGPGPWGWGELRSQGTWPRRTELT